MTESAPHPRCRPPFPGLRPFTTEEASLFFGREAATNDLVRLLGRQGLAAVVGTSGCGKSSLVRAGLLPALLAGYASAAGSRWQIADFRPGGDPLGNLAQALKDAGLGEGTDRAALSAASAAVPQAVAKARDEGRLEPEESLLLLVDQFEELFRYEARRESAAADREEKAHFVALLLAAARRREQRIFVVLTLRAEFLGDCAQFRDLPEAINAAQYLVPRMTRQQRRAAIEGPVQVAQAAIAPRLVHRMLNELPEAARGRREIPGAAHNGALRELGEDPDPLPLLQHALMRTWEAWQEREQPRGPIDFADYEAVGALQEALDRHADETLDEACRRLGPRGPRIVQRIFQRLRVRDHRGRETRSPASVRELRAVAEASLKEVQTAVDCFRDDENGRTFLTPFKSRCAEVDEADEIDVSHESLLRGWATLAKWAREEEDSRRTYVRLAERAEDEGAEQNPLRGSLLDRAAEWWDERQPNVAWGGRYHPGFAAAARYLADSRALHAREQQEKDQRRREEEERAVSEALREAEAQAEILRARATARHATVVRRFALGIAALSLAGLVLAVASILTIRKARKDAVVRLLASKAALAATEDGVGLEVSLLLAANSVGREPTPEGKALVLKALALLPPPLPRLPASRARQVAFGDGGNLLALLGEDGTAHVWDTQSLAPRRSRELFIRVATLAFAQGAPVLAGVGQGAVILWEVRTHRTLARFECPGTRPALALDDAGTTAAALCAGQLRAWKAADTSWQKVREISHQVPGGPWEQLALAGDGEEVALGAGPSRDPEDLFSAGSHLTVVHLGSGRELARLAPEEPATGLAILRSLWEHTLVVGDRGGNLRIWPLPEEVPATPADLSRITAQTVFKHSAPLTALARSMDNYALIAGYRDGVTRIWDLSEGGEAARLVGGGEPVTSVALAPGTQAFTVGGGLDLQGWDLADRRNTVPMQRVFGGQFCCDGALVLYRNQKGSQLLDVAQHRVLGSWELKKGKGTYPIAIAPGAAAAAVRFRREQSSYLSVAALSPERQLGAPRWRQPAEIQGILGTSFFSPDGQHLAGYIRRDIRPRPRSKERLGLFVWNVATGAEEVYRPIDNPRDTLVPGFAFTPDSTRILIAPHKSRVREISLVDRRERELSFPERTITALAFSPEGRLLALAVRGTSAAAENDEQDTDRIVLRSYPVGRELTSCKAVGWTSRLAFSPDSRYLLSGARGGEIALWNVDTGKQEARFAASSPLLAFAMTRGEAIITLEQRQLTLRPWQPADLIREACRRVRRNLTREQWERYAPREEYEPSCTALP